MAWTERCGVYCSRLLCVIFTFLDLVLMFVVSNSLLASFMFILISPASPVHLAFGGYRGQLIRHLYICSRSQHIPIDIR